MAQSARSAQGGDHMFTATAASTGGSWGGSADGTRGLTAAQLRQLDWFESVLNEFIAADGPAMPASRIKVMLGLLRDVNTNSRDLATRIGDYDVSKVNRDIGRFEGKTRFGNAIPALIYRRAEGVSKVAEWTPKGREWRADVLSRLMARRA